MGFVARFVGMGCRAWVSWHVSVLEIGCAVVGIVLCSYHILKGYKRCVMFYICIYNKDDNNIMNKNIYINYTYI